MIAVTRKSVLVFAVLCIPLCFSQTQTDSLLVFYSPDCRHCEYLLGAFLPSIEKDFGLSVKTYNVDIAKNLYFLEKLEENVKEIGDELPAVFFKDSVIYGSEKIFKELRDIIEQYRSDARYHLTYFTKTGCRECSRVDNILKVLVREHSNVMVHGYDINIKENKLLAEAISQSLGIPEQDRLIAPTVFLGKEYYVKGDIKLSALEQALHRYSFGTQNWAALNPQIQARTEQSILDRFAGIAIAGVAGAGFLDGINPCAFATIVFFVSYLIFAGRRRRDIVVMSIFFVIAVFLTYFVIGLGFYQALSFAAGFKAVARVVFIGFGVLAIVLGGVSVFDFVKARQGKLAEMKLQLPRTVKQKIHETIKEKTSSLGIGVGAFVVGVLISLFEFGCTGQVYLPTITYVVSNPALRTRAIGLLVLYNLMFILPLILISVMGVMFSSERVGQFLKDRIALIKILTALLFFGLGLLLVFYSH